jgi:hypothetical protein
MGQKQDKEFYGELSKKGFHEYMEMYTGLLHEYNQMMIKCMANIEAGEQPSKNHLYKMRQKTIDVEKFGKQFRERTVAMEKEA